MPHRLPARWRADAVAGFAVWAAAVPEALACAAIAGLPLTAGLYALAPALLLYALAGRSRQLVVGPTPVTAALSAAVAAPLVVAGGRPVAVLAGVALVCGVAGVVAGGLRLGFVGAGIPRPVRRGFGAGLAVVVVIGQLPALLGVPGTHGLPWRQACFALSQAESWQWRAAVLGGGCLVLVLVLQRWLPLVPASLAAAVTGVAVARLLLWGEPGMLAVERLEPGPPPLGWPQAIAPRELLVVLGPALAVLVFAFAEGLAVAERLAVQDGYRVAAHRELFGLGLANVGAALCSGLLVGGSPAQTAMLRGAGARSRWAGLVVAALTLVTLLTLTGMFEGLPRTVVAVIAIAAAVRLADPADLRRLLRIWRERRTGIYADTARADCAAALATAVAVPLLGVLAGLLVGLCCALLLLLHRCTQPTLVASGTGHVPAVAPAGAEGVRDTRVLMVRVESAAHFANADRLRDRVAALCTPRTRLVVLDTDDCPVIDVTAARTLGELSAALAWRGIAVRLVRRTARAGDASAQAWAAGGPIRVYPTVRAAVAGTPG
ncbi:SulP family inorganic anion transporter [Nocardia blacklockiae]|nr:SulP family inorganic anion transporter [Nocardia blacklockiae]